MQAQVFPLADQFAFPRSANSKQYTYPRFAPTLAPALVARAYAYWKRGGFQPLPPNFLEQVLLTDAELEAHLWWFDKVINYRKDNA